MKWQTTAESEGGCHCRIYWWRVGCVRISCICQFQPYVRVLYSTYSSHTVNEQYTSGCSFEPIAKGSDINYCISITQNSEVLQRIFIMKVIENCWWIGCPLYCTQCTVHCTGMPYYKGLHLILKFCWLEANFIRTIYSKKSTRYNSTRTIPPINSSTKFGEVIHTCTVHCTYVSTKVYYCTVCIHSVVK